jgi:hypothetical protein
MIRGKSPGKLGRPDPAITPRRKRAKVYRIISI